MIVGFFFLRARAKGCVRSRGCAARARSKDTASSTGTFHRFRQSKTMATKRALVHATPGFEVLANEKQEFTDRTRVYLQRRVKETDEIPLTLEEENELVGQARKEKLGEWLATGLCGNNITSSALYVVALCSVPAGKFAPVALLCIAGLLYLFRRIYEEVVTALPVNGGTYNLLLNTTTKGNASIAACLTMLSYVTTAVISSTSAMRYLHTLCNNCEEFDVILATCITLSIAAILNLMGITESAVVALVIFLFHMLSMVMLWSLVWQHHGHADCKLDCWNVYASRRLCGHCRRENSCRVSIQFFLKHTMHLL